MVARFDELESEVRRRARRDEADYLPNLQEMFAQARPREAPPPKSWMRRPGSLEPLGPYRGAQDPSVDTFEQRFNPKAPYKKELPYGVPPGTRERFGDPSKVIADVSGRVPPSLSVPYANSPVGKNSDKQPYQVELPEGFSLEPPRPQIELPEGFSTTPPGEGPAIPEDPFERAAIRTRRPVGARAEGGATRTIEAVVPAIGQEAERLGNIAQVAMETGDLPPQQAMEMALMANPASAAYKTGMSIARAARTPAELAQIETGVMSIPRAAEGGQFGQATGRAISAAPVGGGKLRAAAERSTEELRAAGTAAAARPTGEVVDQSVAGGIVQQGLAGHEGLPTRLRGLLRGSNEDAIGSIIKMAGSKTGADINTLAQLRRYVPVGQQAEVQGALISRLGQSPRTAEFDPATWVRNYGGLSDRGKNVLFGREGNDLRRHLDAIESVSRRAPSWQQFQRERSTLGSKIGVASLIGVAVGATAAPLTVLGATISTAVLGRALARPATAAPIAQWSRAYERVVRTSGAPQALATFTIATRNLNNSLGTDVDPVAILKESQDGQLPR